MKADRSLVKTRPDISLVFNSPRRSPTAVAVTAVVQNVQPIVVETP
jgi:hypothetical protein